MQKPQAQLANVTRLRKDGSKHDLLNLAGDDSVNLYFRVSPCSHGVVLRYVRKLKPEECIVNVMGMQLQTGEPGDEKTVIHWHVEKKWFDPFLGGYDRKVSRALAKLKRNVRRREEDIRRAESIQRSLEA